MWTIVIERRGRFASPSTARGARPPRNLSAREVEISYNDPHSRHAQKSAEWPSYVCPLSSSPATSWKPCCVSQWYTLARACRTLPGRSRDWPFCFRRVHLLRWFARDEKRGLDAHHRSRSAG